MSGRIYGKKDRKEEKGIVYVLPFPVSYEKRK